MNWSGHDALWFGKLSIIELTYLIDIGWFRDWNYFKYINMGFPGSSAGKESTCNAGDPGSIPGEGKIPWWRDRLPTPVFFGIPDGSGGKNPPAMWETWVHSIPELGRSPGGGHGNSLQYSCLEKPHGQRSLVSYIPWGHKESDITEQPSTAQHNTSNFILWGSYYLA